MLHLTDGMDKVVTVEIFETVLIRVVCIGTTVEVMGRGIFNPVLVTSIL